MKMYELSIENAYFWQRIEVDNEVKYVKKHVDSKFNVLQLFKIKNPKKLSFYSDMWFCDCFSGRVLAIEKIDDKYIVFPSNVELPIESLREIKRFNSYTDEIMFNEANMDSYINASEDFIFNSYFCDLINEETGLEVISESLLNDKINEVREVNKINADSVKKGKKLNRTKK